VLQVWVQFDGLHVAAGSLPLPTAAARPRGVPGGWGAGHPTPGACRVHAGGGEPV